MVAPVGRVGDHPVSELWVVAVDGTGSPRRLTSGEAYDSAPRWAGDSLLIYFLSDRAERGTAQLHRVGLVDGVVQAVTCWAGGVSGHLPLTGAGISDWGMLAATGEQGPFEAALGGSSGWEGPDPHRHDRLSPISYASRVRTPMLIMHGENDTNVPVSQAEFFHRALRRFGVEHEYVVYPRENHSIRERNHQLDVLRRTHAWLDRWLG
ncbi:hypothetical protein GCM10011608_44950 [Micromonospora sonchi]|uniref:Peptidase S9 prolyl oligopeptidase catalytic domain-containing protein n=1 Tax=Micromonospora sonchi TaxID=1763543 RepID=A0A917U4R6_9ACTN|nr:hypothetical protein GCM10011608_44950 [Micromonospora sonchi]